MARRETKWTVPHDVFVQQMMEFHTLVPPAIRGGQLEFTLARDGHIEEFTWRYIPPRHINIDGHIFERRDA